MTTLPTPSAWRYTHEESGRIFGYQYDTVRPKNYNHPNYTPMFTQGQLNQYGQACFEEGRSSTPPTYGWLIASDEEMVCAHLGVAELSDSFGVAKKKLQSLIDWHIAVATDPAVNGAAAMTAVADRFAHSLALELECVLADRPNYYDKAMQVLSEYRMEMNAIHEQHSPTFMGEPVLGEIEP